MGTTDYKRYHEYRNNEMHPKDIRLPQYLINVLPKTKSSPVLDIGCGNGSILYALKKRGYTNLQGIDLDEDAVEYCKKAGIPCEKTDIFDFSVPGGVNSILL